MKPKIKHLCTVGFACLLMSLSPMTVAAQSSVKEISGIVVDSSGEPVVGAAVRAKNNKSIGTITNANGEFKLSVKPGTTLVFTYIGYKTSEATVGSKNTMKVQMQDDSQELNETVVIAYGSVKKRDLTGSVASLRSDELMRVNPTNVNQGLQGKLAGVVVSQSDGAPGAGINIQIRGANSFTTSCEPLYIVDGIPFDMGEAPQTDYGMKQTNNPLSSLSPSDIESVEVLKDASATAIYGSRGANGVVIITTKKGKGDKTNVEFRSTFSTSSPVKKIDVLSAAEYAEYRNELVINGYLYDGKNYTSDYNLPYPSVGRWSETKLLNPDTGQMEVVSRTYLPSPDDFRNGFYREEGDTELFYGTNWQDEIFHTAFSKDYSLTVSGGNDKGSYLYSGGVLDQQGVIRNSYYKRYTVRANNTRKVNDFIEIGSSINFSKSDNRLARTNTENYGVIESAISFNPTRPVFDPTADSGFSEDFSTGLANPYLVVKTEKNILSSINVNANGFAEVTFTPWLKFRQNVGYSYSYYERSQYYNRYTGAGQNPTNGYAVKSDSNYEGFTEESLLSFNKTFGIHSFNAVAGITYQIANWRNKGMNAKTFATDDTEDNDMSAATGDKEISSGRGKSQLMSYLFRLNYGLLDRYLFTTSVRRDGSSRLALNRWSNFYSGAIAWRASDEPFIKKLNFFDNLKLRASAGQTGNQGVNAYATRSRFVATNYPMDGKMLSGMAEDRWGGPAAANLKWETTTQYDLGLDLSIFNSRVNLTIDYYWKKTKDLLQYKLIPMSSGFKEIASNYGNVSNRGLEISGRFTPIRKSSFSWNIDANIAFNKNKISGLDAPQYSDVVWGMESMFIRRNGSPIGLLYGYVEDGFYDNEAEVRADPFYANESDSKVKSMVGQIKYKNMDDDPVIDQRDKDVIGNTNPDYTYGITNTFTYKDWTFSFFLQGSQGNDVLNTNLLPFNLVSSNNMPKFVWYNRWTADNRAAARWPRPDGSYTRSMKASDRYVEDGSYLRCKNVSLSYNWRNPVKFINALTFTASATNLFTITGYDWYDPDVSAFGSDSSRHGVDLSSYPSARSFNFSIQVSL